MPNWGVDEDGSTFAQLLEFAPDAIIGVSEAGMIVLANQQAAALFGYAREELSGCSIDQLVPDGARLEHPRHRDAYFRDPRTRPMGEGLDLAGRRADGTEFPAEISLSSLDADGSRIALVAVRDVTDRRAAAQAQARLAAIVESSGDAIIGHGADGVITSWNPAAEELYGYTSEEAVGQSIALLAWGDVAATLGPPNVTPVREEDAIHLRKDGTRVEVVQTVSQVRGPAGEDHGMATIVRDVTAARRAQRTFEGLLEFAPDAIIGVQHDGLISLANRQAEALFGYGRNQLAGVHVDQLVPRRVGSQHAAHREAYLADPRTRPMGAGRELAGRRRDGSEFPAEISLSSLETADGTIAVAAVRDLSDRAESERERNLQEELNQARRLESVGQLAGGIAHDFNNLLGVILSLADLTAQDLPDGSPQRSDLEEIARAAERGAALTRQLLIFSRREVIQREVLEPVELIRGVEMLLRRALGERIELVVQVQGSVSRIEADRGQLEQVLVNLAVNARDAMPEGGRLVIDLSQARVGEDESAAHVGLAVGDYVRMTVRDTGIGMPREVVERAFEPFFSTKPKGQGTGLGLATVYGIVAEAGGHLSLESAPGQGTSVCIHLPATQQPVPPGSAPGDGSSGGGGERILLVEDEEGMRDAAARILQRGGYQVIVAADAAQALEQARDERIDLVVTDVIMPGMVGPDLVRELRSGRPGLKVIFMSGYSHKVLEADALEEPGRTAFVEKPFSASALRDAVRKLLDAPAPLL